MASFLFCSCTTDAFTSRWNDFSSSTNLTSKDIMEVFCLITTKSVAGFFVSKFSCVCLYFGKIDLGSLANVFVYCIPIIIRFFHDLSGCNNYPSYGQLRLQKYRYSCPLSSFLVLSSFLLWLLLCQCRMCFLNTWSPLCEVINFFYKKKLFPDLNFSPKFTGKW